jgi:hypothetical protein
LPVFPNRNWRIGLPPETSLLIATFLERDEGKQFFRVGVALISGADEMSIKHNRDDQGD